MARVSTKAPGVVVAEALKKLGATVEKLSEASGIPVAKINAVINKGEPITPELSVRLGKVLGEKDSYFAELQLRSDIVAAAKEVGKIAKLRKPAGRPGRKPAGPPAEAAQTPAKKRGRKPAGSPAEVAQTPAKKRGRKPAGPPAEAAQTPAKKRGRKPAGLSAEVVQTPAKKRGRKPGQKPKE